MCPHPCRKALCSPTADAPRELRGFSAFPTAHAKQDSHQSRVQEESNMSRMYCFTATAPSSDNRLLLPLGYLHTNPPWFETFSPKTKLVSLNFMKSQPVLLFLNEAHLKFKNQDTSTSSSFFCVKPSSAQTLTRHQAFPSPQENIKPFFLPCRRARQKLSRNNRLSIYTHQHLAVAQSSLQTGAVAGVRVREELHSKEPKCGLQETGTAEGTR